MFEITHDSRAHRLSVELKGQTERLDYELYGKVMSITHTRVWSSGSKSVPDSRRNGKMAVSTMHTTASHLGSSQQT